MATEDDLIKAVRDSLKVDGELCRIKTEMLNKIINLLDSSSFKTIKHLNRSHNVLFVNELIREYLHWIGYKYTLNALVIEGKQKDQPIERMFLAQHLGIDDDEKTKQLPLLFCLVETLKNLKATEDQ